MGAKKKGKTNKLAKMSEEERIRYLQHRAAIEEEARRRKEQLISIFMKNKLKREEAFSRLNMAKINQQWRQTLRQIKCIELKQDLEDLYKWFEYTSNKKSKLVEMLLSDLEEAAIQYSRIHHCHTETIDRLIKIHDQRVGHFYEQYKQDQDEMYEKANVDLEDIVNSYTFDEEHLQAIIYRMEKTFEEKTSDSIARHNSKIDELRNNMLTELENLTNSREQQIEKIWQNFETILKQYWEQTEERRKQYLLMKETDLENCRQIFENNEQINATIEVINNLKDEFANAQAANNERFLELKTNKEDSQKLLFDLKKEIFEETESDRKKLNFMNSTAEKTTDELKKILAKGEQILNVQSLCRKLETLNEKVCPEGLDKLELTDKKNEVEEEVEEPVEPSEEVGSEMAALDGFWKRFNRVLLEKEALALHYQSLLNEQKQLKALLKSYLSEVVVKKPEAKVSYANGTKIGRQRPFTCLPATRKTPFSVTTCIDAAHSPSVRYFLSSQVRS